MNNEVFKGCEDFRPEQTIEKLDDSSQRPALCEKCSKVPFQWSELSDISSFDEHRNGWSPGNFGDLRPEECSFCHLVESLCWAAGSSWDKLSKPDSSREVRLLWDQNYNGFYVAQLSPIGSYICFCEADETSLVRAKRTFEAWIDINTCKLWLSDCETRHHPKCAPIGFDTRLLSQSDGRPMVMRVVDVETMCVTDASQSCRYLALSYIWGNANDGRLVLNSNNKDALTKPFGLRAHWHLIPTTISSSINLVKNLGERYLWVDSLCLVQDDETELAGCTRMMDNYYAMATVTIVAASGTDAYAGLPGIYPTERKGARPVREILPRKWMTVVEDVDRFLRRSYYSGRGWTMQEELCSFRLLIFINNQVYFRCRETTFNEDTTVSNTLEPAPSGHSLIPLVFEEPVDFWSFEMLMYYYSRRNLTYQSDILHACFGMLRKLVDAMGEKLVEGLPTPLERSLLFSNQEPLDRSDLRRQGFPSYSWTGWEYIAVWETDRSEVAQEQQSSWYHGPITQEQMTRTWITWYKRQSNHEITEINRQENQESTMTKTSGDTGEPLADDLRAECLTRHDSHFSKQVPDFAYDILCFRTISVYLNVSLAQTSTVAQSKGLCLAYGVKGVSFGEFNLDANDIDVNSVQEFALVSEYRYSWQDRVEVGWWGLLLRRTGALAERRGILKIPEKLLNQTLSPGPLWNWIILG